ncbi:MAG: DUF58 domain-containing protein [Holophagae bacterium]|jgi:uncharacterized protein (DUF58 family)
MSFASAFPGFKLRLTRWGAGFIVACVILGLAAVNTGNNALMAILSLALGSYVVSGTWSRQVLAAIDVDVSLPPECFAGRAAIAEVTLRNRSRLFPAYGVVLRDRDGRPLLTEPLVRRDRACTRSVRLCFDRRGWTEVGPWRIEVLLPLGFFVKSKELLRGRRTLVLPRLLDVEPAVELDRGGGRRSPDELSDRGREGDVTQLREFRDGDDHRQMHWKQTARQQRPIVVDRQHAAAAPVYLVLDPRLPDPDDPASRDRFEHTVSEVATVAVRRLQRGTPVGLVVGSTLVPPVRDPRQAACLLRPLAEVEPCAAGGAGPRVPERRSSAVYSVAGTP